MTRLSFCIPTYNRADCIVDTLNSILVQATDSIEIVVCDNASTDNTATVIKEFQNKFPRLTYFRWDTNVGADRNFLKVIELATGDYCWFMSSDDIVEPNGLNTVLGALQAYKGLSGVSVNGFTYSRDMKTRTGETILVANKIGADRLFTDPDSAFSTLGEYFGYLSGQIINRELWCNVVANKDPTPYFISYVHLFVIANMVVANPCWFYSSTKCVGWRGNNDSFLSEGRYKRLEIDVLGFEKIYRDVIGEYSRGYREVMKTVCSVYVRHMVLAAKFKGAPISFYIQGLRLSIRMYWMYPVFWLKTFPLFIFPRFTLILARMAYRLVLKSKKLGI